MTISMRLSGWHVAVELPELFSGEIMLLAKTGTGMTGANMLHWLWRGGIELVGYERSEGTAGVTGSLLSFGSVAGVALTGQASGVYSFLYRLNWILRVESVYGASIKAHMSLNYPLFR